MKKKLILSVLVAAALGACSSQQVDLGPNSLAGNMTGNEVKSHEQKVGQQEQAIIRQQQKLDQQEREIEDLQRQRYLNNQLRQY